MTQVSGLRHLVPHVVKIHQVIMIENAVCDAIKQHKGILTTFCSEVWRSSWLQDGPRSTLVHSLAWLRKFFFSISHYCFLESLSRLFHDVRCISISYFHNYWSTLWNNTQLLQEITNIYIYIYKLDKDFQVRFQKKQVFVYSLECLVVRCNVSEEGNV